MKKGHSKSWINNRIILCASSLDYWMEWVSINRHLLLLSFSKSLLYCIKCEIFDTLIQISTFAVKSQICYFSKTMKML